MLKAFKYRIYPNSAQAQMIDQTLDACRFVYNLALETRAYAWKASGVYLKRSELQSQLTDVLRSAKWLRGVNSQALYATLEILDRSYRAFFNGGGFPKYKSKKGRQSFRCCNNRRRIDWENSTLSIPRIKNLPIRISRRFTGSIRTVTIIKTVSGKYLASVLVETPADAPLKSPVNLDTAIGIDLGIKSFAVTSDGDTFEPNRKFKKASARLKCLQRRASRKKKGSKNKKKANLKVALLHEKISNQRADYIHKITTQLIRDSQAQSFVIEDLNVAGMVKNRNLANAISDAAFYEFGRQMQYKCEWYGKNLIVIDRFAPSSKRCSDCGALNNDLELKDREWTCSCGSHHDRDFNAAKNIKYFGLKKYSGRVTPGEPVESRRMRRAKKQEKQIVESQKDYSYVNHKKT